MVALSLVEVEKDYRSVPLPAAIKKLFPFESRFHRLTDGVVHYVDHQDGSGDKPVVLLLHGNPTWSFYFRNLIRQLAPHFRVIAPDYLGCGLSERPVGKRFRAIDRIHQTLELIDALGVKRFSLVMHDWGGSIGSGVAIRRAESIERLVYLNTTLTETESLPLIIKLAASPITGRFLTRHTRNFLRVTTDIGVAKKLPKDVRNGYMFPYRHAALREAIWDFVDDIPFDSDHPTYIQMMELAISLPSLSQVPVQIVWGLRDPCFHREMLSRVAELFPQAEILEFANASHLVLEDEPERAGSAILGFLQRAGAPAKEGAPTHLANPHQAVLLKNLLRWTKETPLAEAVISPAFLGDMVHYQHLNFRAMRQLITKYERGLISLGLKAGDKVLMLVPGGSEFLALSYAVMARGAVPFYLDPGMGKENLLRCIEEIAPDVFIGSAKAQLLRIFKKKYFKSIKFHIVASDWVYGIGPNLSFLKKYASIPLEEATGAPVAMVAYTSGGTGKPKGVVFTQEMVQDQLRILRDVFGLENGKRDLPLLTIFSLFHLANGVCSVFGPIDSSKPLTMDPVKMVTLINDLGINYSFGSPTLWNKISEYCIRSRSSLPSMEKVFMAGAPVHAEVLKKLAQVVPQGEAFTPYGATEALPVTLVSAREIAESNAEKARGGELGTYVGKAILGIQMRIIAPVEGPLNDIADVQYLSAYEIGEIIVQGSNVSAAYYNLSAAFDSGKIPDGLALWHRMGDLGYLDTQGALYFCGRKVHAVAKQDGTLMYSIPVEMVFNRHPKAKRSALIALGTEREAAIVVEPHPHYWPETEDQRETFRRELLVLGAENLISQPIRKIFFHRSFPVDARHNAKIFRDKLGVWATEQLKLEL